MVALRSTRTAIVSVFSVAFAPVSNHGAISALWIRPTMKVCSPPAVKAFAHLGPPAKPGEVGFDSGFINEHQPVRLLAHARLAAVDPFPSRLTQSRSVTLLRDQPFF